MRSLALVAIVGFGCGSSSFFACEDDNQCRRASGSGLCQPQGYCSFPDEGCPSGQRYGAQAGDGLAGSCVPSSGTGTTSVTSTSTTTSTTTTAGPSSGGTSATTGSSGSSDDGATTGPVIDPDLVVWFRMDDDPNDGVADGTQNGFDGSCVPTCPILGIGQIGDAYRFSGDQYIAAPHGAALEVSAITVAAWVWVEPDVGLAHFVAKPVGQTLENSFELFVDSNAGGAGARFSISDGVSSGQASAGPQDLFAFQQWHHIAGTWDGAEARVFVDGAAVGSAQVASIGFDGSDLLVGADIDSGAPLFFLDGQIDDVRIYRRALSEAEIGALLAQ